MDHKKWLIFLFSVWLFSAQLCYGNNNPKKYFVENFGAVSDGKTVNTRAIQKAIDEASLNGGGLVIFLKGKYLTGRIILKSDVTLFFENGSQILGSTDPVDYQKLEINDGPKSPDSEDNSKLALLNRVKFI